MTKINSVKSFILHALAYLLGIYLLIIALNEILALVGSKFETGSFFPSFIYYIDRYGIIVAFLVTFAYLWLDVQKSKRVKYMAIFSLIFALLYYFDFYARYS